MRVEKLRSTSSGLKGTLANIDHHAQKLKPLVCYLAARIPSMPYGVWRQGNNVHVLRTRDEREFVIRPLCLGEQGYVALRLFARWSRSQEMALMTCFVDHRNGVTREEFLAALHNLAEVPVEGQWAGKQD